MIISFVVMILGMPADFFLIVYFLFLFSFNILNYVLEMIDIPVFAEYAVAVVIAIAILTDWLANKALDLSVHIFCSKIPLLEHLF